MATINVEELLKTKTRQEVCDLLVDYNFACNQSHALQIMTIILGENDGDVVRLDRAPKGGK